MFLTELLMLGRPGGSVGSPARRPSVYVGLCPDRLRARGSGAWSDRQRSAAEPARGSCSLEGASVAGAAVALDVRRVGGEQWLVTVGFTAWVVRTAPIGAPVAEEGVPVRRG